MDRSILLKPFRFSVNSRIDADFARHGFPTVFNIAACYFRSVQLKRKSVVRHVLFLIATVTCCHQGNLTTRKQLLKSG